MNLKEELKKEINVSELNRMSFYIANCESINIKKRTSKKIFSDRVKSVCNFYKCEEMDPVKPYKPISKLINFEAWIRDEK